MASRLPKPVRALNRALCLILLAALVLGGQGAMGAATDRPGSIAPQHPATGKEEQAAPASAAAICDLSNPLRLFSDPEKVASDCPKKYGILGVLLVSVVLLFSLAEKLEVLHRFVRWLARSSRKLFSGGGRKPARGARMNKGQMAALPETPPTLAPPQSRATEWERKPAWQSRRPEAPASASGSSNLHLPPSSPTPPTTPEARRPSQTRSNKATSTATPAPQPQPGRPTHPPVAPDLMAVAGSLSQENPFGERGCIRDPERFFNREALLAEIFEALRKGTSLSLVGEKQVGKSSLLAMISCKGPAVLQRDPAEFIHIDMQVIRNEDEFFDALCEPLGLSTRRGYELERALRGRRVVVCLDEIEKMVNPQFFSGEERTELRGHANGPDSPLTLVIASRSELETLFNDDPRSTSPLADLCTTLRVGPFSQATSDAFLLHRLQGNAVTFSPNQRQNLHEQSQGHPGKLQAAAAELYRQLVLS